MIISAKAKSRKDEDFSALYTSIWAAMKGEKICLILHSHKEALFLFRECEVRGTEKHKYCRMVKWCSGGLICFKHIGSRREEFFGLDMRFIFSNKALEHAPEELIGLARLKSERYAQRRKNK